MSSEHGRVLLAIVCGFVAWAAVVGGGALFMRPVVVEHGWTMIVAGPYKLVFAVTVVGSVLAGLVTTVKVYRRMGDDAAA